MLPDASCDSLTMHSGPENLQVGDLLVFGHLTAHKFKQYPTVKANASGAVPVGFTRTAEYPTLVAPWMHGEPHQSIDEILACLLIGTPPRHWAHTYTGNAIPCSDLFLPALPPLPASPSTPLARLLVGVDKFALCPHAVAWMLNGVGDGQDSLLKGLKQAIGEHKRQMLTEMLAALNRRLRRLASSRETDLLNHAETDAARAAFAQRSPLATSVASAVPAAAQAAALDTSLISSSKRARLAACQSGVRGIDQDNA